MSFSDVLFYPKPVQKPHPPIWVGGESPAALRRAVKFGDAWYPGNNSQTKPLDTAPRLAAGIADVKRMCEAAKRDPASLGITLLVQDVFDWGQHKTQDGSARRMFTGSSADMAADAAALSAHRRGPCGAAAGRRRRPRMRGAHRAVRRRGDREANVVGVGDADTKLLVVIPGLVPGRNIAGPLFCWCFRRCRYPEFSRLYPERYPECAPKSRRPATVRISAAPCRLKSLAARFYRARRCS